MIGPTIRRAWALLNLPCEGIQRLGSEAIDRDLTPIEGAAVRSHRLYCGACRRSARQVDRLRAALRRLSGRIEDDLLPGPGLPDEARARIERAIRDA